VVLPPSGSSNDSSSSGSSDIQPIRGIDVDVWKILSEKLQLKIVYKKGRGVNINGKLVKKAILNIIQILI